MRWLGSSWRHSTPVAAEVLAKIEDEVLDEIYFPALDTHYRDTAVCADASLPVGQVDVPVHGDHVGTGKVEEVANTEVLNVEPDPRELIEEPAEPAFDGALALNVPLSGMSPG